MQPIKEFCWAVLGKTKWAVELIVCTMSLIVVLDDEDGHIEELVVTPSIWSIGRRLRVRSQLSGWRLRWKGERVQEVRRVYRCVRKV